MNQSALSDLWSPRRSPALRHTLALTFFMIVFLLGAQRAEAQWKSETFTLKGGWNAIYLHGDAPDRPLDTLLPPEIEELWRWVPNANPVGFIVAQDQPTRGTKEWLQWRRTNPTPSSFPMTGQTAYLIKCSGTSNSSYFMTLDQRILPPKATWVRNGANLLGFPTRSSSGTFPIFSNYFASFQAPTASSAKIFKYIGGDLSATNPQLVTSPASERLDRNKAYWFDAEVVNNFYAPIEINLSTNAGFDFSRTGSVITAQIKNRSANPMTLTLAPQDSLSAPVGEEVIAGPVLMTKRAFNPAQLVYEETAITAAYTEVIPAQTTVELQFGINRNTAAMTGAAANALFASFLRITDSGNLIDIQMPVTARKSSLAGLWLGEVSVTNVSNKVTNGAHATATVVDGVITEIAVNGTGGFGYTAAPVVTIAPSASGTDASATAVVENGSVTGITINNGGSGYKVTAPKVSIDLPPPLPGSSTPNPFPLRTIIHVPDSGAERLLSQVFIGQLAAAPNDVGVCTLESLLKQDAKATAHRLVAAHLPLDQVISRTSGSMAVGQQLTFVITVPYNDPTSPFVHQYHPDHDNKTARFANANAGDESYNITRTCTFTFTATPPGGGGLALGWGSSVFGGTYRELITGVHKQTLQVDGTFEIRRASEVGKLKPLDP